MGDLRDQLKKIKRALGFGDLLERKEVAPQQRYLPRPSEATVNKQPLISLPKSSSQTEPEPQKSRVPNNSLQRSFKKKPLTPIKRLQPVLRAPQRAKMANESSLGVAITRTVAPSRLAVFSPVVTSATARLDQFTLPSFAALTRTSEFKNPDTWVSRGKSSQITSTVSGHRSDIFIGLDFGTAFTKAAVQILDNIYPVDWSGVAKLKNKFLLPTEYSEILNKECFLGQHPNSSIDGLHTNLKSPFITQRVSDPSLAKASVFIALVLQYIRAFVYHYHSVKLGAVSIGWYLNIGIPSDVLDRDKHARHYKKLVDVAWELSLLPQTEITYENAFKYLAQSIKHEPDLREVETVPELVAQLAGYSKSSRRQNGLHALVDIGGGTVDMVTFNVHQVDGDDVFPFFIANVKPLGAYALLENRFLNLPMQASVMSSDVQDLLAAETFAKFSDSHVRSVRDIDRQFFGRFQQEFEAVLRTTHQARYPTSPNWQTGIRTFISGGGAYIPGYSESIRFSHLPSNCRLLEMDLPPHPKLVNFDQELSEYNRISVACGLAVDRLSLGFIRPVSEVDDFMLVKSLPVRERPDRDELYPK